MNDQQIQEEKPFLGVSRIIFLVGFVSFLTDFSSEMIVPILPLFLTNVLHTSMGTIGIIEGVAESTASVLKLFSGWLSDQMGKRKPLMMFGYGLSNLIKPLFALTTSGWQVLLIRFGDRFGKGLRGAPRDALLADSTTKEQRGKAFGYHRAMDTMGAVMGPLIAYGNTCCLSRTVSSGFLGLRHTRDSCRYRFVFLLKGKEWAGSRKTPWLAQN